MPPSRRGPETIGDTIGVAISGTIGRLLRGGRAKAGARAGGHRYEPPRPAGRDGSYLTVLDAGHGAIKAIVLDLDVDLVPGGNALPVVVGAAAEAAPPDVDGRAAPFAEYVAAAERAVVAAEDAAGVVPRRVVLAVGGATPAIGRGFGALRRRRPGAPLTVDEIGQALDRARAAALAGALRQAGADQAPPPALEAVQLAVRALRLDGRVLREDGRGRPLSRRPGERLGERQSGGRGGRAPGYEAGAPFGAAFDGETGEDLDVDVDAGLAPAAEVTRQHRLAEALDLEVAGLVSLPLALAEAIALPAGGAILIDAGAGSTTVVLTGPEGIVGAATLPLGSAALETALAAELGVSPEVAADVLLAHAAGALRGGRSSAAGPGAGRVARRLAAFHAEVLADALELTLATLAHRQSLPRTILLCGGAAALPEMRQTIDREGWGTTLPFSRPPTVQILDGRDVRGVDDRAFALPALQSVASLAAAAAAPTVVGEPTAAA